MRLREELAARGLELRRVSDPASLAPGSLRQCGLILLDHEAHPWGRVRPLFEAMEERPPLVVVGPAGARHSLLQAVGAGAWAYLLEPLDAEGVAQVALRAREVRRLGRELRWMRRMATPQPAPPLWGESQACQRFCARLREAARRPAHLLLAGEPGTERAQAARGFHALGSAEEGPFFHLDWRGQAPSVVRRELLERGPPGESPAELMEMGGTLFLDEMNLLPPPLQERIAERVREAPSPAFRVLIGYRGELGQIRRRKDLVPALGSLPAERVEVPPLRERRRDIPALASRVLEVLCEAMKGEKKRLSPGAARWLSSRPWPGNLEELTRVLARACALASGEVVDARHLEGPPAVVEGSRSSLEAILRERLSDVIHRQSPHRRGDLYEVTIESVERVLLQVVLRETGGNQVRAARLLGLNRNTLRRKVVQLGLAPKGRG
ncbi:MAG: sigma-54-dependent transcriptional regulator [Nitrospinota bacterium]